MNNLVIIIVIFNSHAAAVKASLKLALIYVALQEWTENLYGFC